MKYLRIILNMVVVSLIRASRRSIVQAFIHPIHKSGRAGKVSWAHLMSFSSSSELHGKGSLTRTEVRQMKVVDLRQELKARGLDTEGLRKDLLDRLLCTIPAVGNNMSTLLDAKLDDKQKKTNEKEKKKEPEKLKISPESLYVLRFKGQSHHLSATASCGLILYHAETEKKIWSGTKFFSTGQSAQLAEMNSIDTTLACFSKLGLQKLIIQGHAGGTTIQQLQGNYSANSKDLREAITKIKANMDSFEECEVWGIAADQVAMARNLASKSLSLRQSEGFELIQSSIYGVSKPSTNEYSDLEDTTVLDADLGDISRENSYLDSDETTRTEEFHTAEECPSIVKTSEEVDEHFISLPSFSPNKTYVLRFDGGSRGNPGTAGSGMVLFDSESGLEVWSAFQYLGDTTNNVAEYTALFSGIKFASAMGIKHLIAEGDSTLVVKQVTGEYKVKADHLKDLNQGIKELVNTFDSFSIYYIPRAENFRADQLANIAMDELTTMGLEIFDHFEEQNEMNSDTTFETIPSTPTKSIESPETTHISSPQDQALVLCVPIPEASLSDRQLSPQRTYVLKFGGGVRGAGLGAGAIIMDDISGEKIWSGAYFYDSEEASQFIAGYAGLIVGLRKAESMGVRRLIVESNMEFVIHQMSSKWKVKSDVIKPFHAHAKEFCEHYFEDVDFQLIATQDNTQIKAILSETFISRKSRLTGFLQ